MTGKRKKIEAVAKTRLLVLVKRACDLPGESRSIMRELRARRATAAEPRGAALTLEGSPALRAGAGSAPAAV
jgi:hypothetical protein